MERTTINYGNVDYDIIRNVTFTDNYGEEVTIDIATTDLWYAIEQAVYADEEMETKIDNTFGYYVPQEVIDEHDDDAIITYLKENYN